MINCPTCGRPVREGQRFCGNCGTDVQAASTYRSAQTPPPASPAPTPTAGTYSYEPVAYDYAPPPERRLSTTTMALIVGAVALVCLCCGVALGALGMYWLGPVPTSPAPTPTPAALYHLLSVLAT